MAATSFGLAALGAGALASHAFAGEGADYVSGFEAEITLEDVSLSADGSLLLAASLNETLDALTLQSGVVHMDWFEGETVTGEVLDAIPTFEVYDAPPMFFVEFFPPIFEVL